MIANMAASPDRLYLAKSCADPSRPEWVRPGPLKDVMMFDEQAQAVQFSWGMPRSEDVCPEVVCAWMPSVDEILDALDVPKDGRDDVRTLRGAIGNLWLMGVLNVDRLMHQSAGR